MPNKKKNVVVIGSSGHAKVIIDILEKNNEYNIVGLIDSFKPTNENLFGYKILGKEEDLPELIITYNFNLAVIAIGDNWTRKVVFKKIKKISSTLQYISVLHPNAIVGKNVTIGIGTVIAAGAIINCETKIKKFCILNTNSSIDHDGIMEEFSSLAPNATLGGGVFLGTCSAISLGANVIQDIAIGKYTIIGAGALVLKDVPSYSLAYGTPVKIINKIKKGEKYLYRKELTKEKILSKNVKSIAGPITTTSEKLITKEILDMVVISDQYSLECYNLKTKKDISTYKNKLKNFEGFDAFYKTELFNQNRLKNEHKYFILKKDDCILVLMPFTLRKIENKDELNDYFDSTSFYGYSGPLYENTLNESVLSVFWSLVDNWYLKNNVIAEFIRFNLDGNHKKYSGSLVPTLSNVKGLICKSEEEQWNSFIPKVRNNYRKALNNGLTSKVYYKNINIEIIKHFHSIYIDTMNRNNAQNEYYFSLDYFKNLILSNPEKCALVLIFINSVAISTELILLNDKSMYSFLGGTLSAFFNDRPNDFLKIEALNWGRVNKYESYILGGGRKDFDGLYKYKKSFFPKNEDVIYYTGRKIINKKVYDSLTNKTHQNSNLESKNISEGFFPAYRHSNKHVCQFNIITDRDSWKNILKTLGDFDFYHTYDYHQIVQNEDEQPILIQYTNNKETIVLPLIIRPINGTKYFDATSVYGYAGPIGSKSVSAKCIQKFQEQLQIYFREHRIISVFSRLNPFIANQELFLDNIGEICSLSEIVNIDLTKNVEEQRAEFSKTTKRYINKTRKLCDIKISCAQEDLLIFKDLYYENMKRVNAKPSYFFDEQYFFNFCKANDFKTEVIFAIHNETQEIISAAMMIKTNNIIQYHISGTKNNYLNLTPIRLLIDETRINASKEKYKYFNLGGGLGSQEDSLFKFKSSFSKDYKTFKVWKYIVDQKVYDELCKFNTNDDNSNSEESKHFFPLYRD